MRRGFTLIELILVIGIIVILGFLVLPNIIGRRSSSALQITAKELAATLREASARALAESSSSAWGVRVDNVVSSSPFFAEFAGTYSTSTVVVRISLPSGVKYATSSVPLGSALEILFGQGTGRPSATATINLILNSGGLVQSSSISVNSVGAVSY
jgi:prepilin-type N-terminal cleavage/methylation domain-containing protein